MGFIYSIKNEITQDIYVGKTIKTVSERFQRHIYNSRYGSKTHLHRSIRKYGEENFSISIIEETSDELLNEREKHHIQQMKPHYNMTDGGDGGSLVLISEEFREKCRTNNTGTNNPMYGKKGEDNPNFGKKRGKTPLISKALSNPCICEGVWFPSIGEAEKHYKGKYCVRKRLDSPRHQDWYRLVPITKRK
jgi:GIY-YIG catalytic domain/NUMOD3 motif